MASPGGTLCTGAAMLLVVAIVMDRGQFVSTSLPPFFFPAERCHSGVHIDLFGINNLRIILFSPNCTLNCSITIHDSKIDSLVELRWLEFLLQGGSTCQGGYIELTSQGSVIAQRLCKPFPVINLHLTQLTIKVVLDGTGAVVGAGGCYVVLQYKRVGKVEPTEPPGRNLTTPTDPGRIAGIVAGVLAGSLVIPALIYAVYACMPKAIAAAPPVTGWIASRLPLRLRPMPRPIPRPMPRPIPRPMVRPRPRPMRMSRVYRRRPEREPSTAPSSPQSSLSSVPPTWGLYMVPRVVPRFVPRLIERPQEDLPSDSEDEDPAVEEAETVFEYSPVVEYPPEESVHEATMHIPPELESVQESTMALGPE